MPAPDTGAALVDLLTREPRAYTLDELASASSPRKVRAAIARGEASRILPGVYAGAVHRASFAVRADAALLWAGPNAALCGIAAMFVWGFVTEPPETIEVAVPHHEKPHPPSWIRVRRMSWRPPTVRRGRLTVLSADLTVIFGYGSLPRRDRGDVVFRAIRTGATSAGALADTLARVPRCAARRELARRIDSAARGAESFLEEQGLRTVFASAEFGRFLRQHRVWVDGVSFRLDMYDPVTMTAVELDGDENHSSPPDRKRDIARDAMLATVGILTVRLSYGDVMERPAWCRETVREVLRSRA
ncbi:hypothetical protein [Demequina iriomotensis]|uniref:hypothetical protein n=1 Tax=Demequina iriomotensis TaxID=1536641 RepID=UPI0007861576|nr:hypothetical protein [Demequina iriomotensis]